MASHSEKGKIPLHQRFIKQLLVYEVVFQRIQGSSTVFHLYGKNGGNFGKHSQG